MTRAAMMMRPLMAAALTILLALDPRPGAANPSATALAEAMAHAARNDWDAARTSAEAGGPVARDVVEWSRLRAGEGLLGEYEDFLKRRPDWPGLPFLRQKGEVAVARSTTPGRVTAWFADNRPATGAGAVALVRALMALGRTEEAMTEARRAWQALSFTAEDEAALLQLAPDLGAAAHQARLDRLLWDGDRTEAERMLPRVSAGWQALARARLALRTNADGFDALIAAVPADLAGDPGLAFERFVWRMKRDRYDDAAALILDRGSDPTSLGRPDLWADRRAVLTRAVLRRGDPAKAYRIAASHGLTEGGKFADLEFLAGFIALRHLGEPARALEHFRHLETGVATPISTSRAMYWQGRALEAAGDQAGALADYRRAAQHQTAYYGLLAAEKLGLSLDASLLSDAKASPGWRQAGFVNSSVMEAAMLLLHAGNRTLAKRFMLHLAETQDATGLHQMADMALEIGEPHIAVLLAKQAAERGVILPHAYFPVVGMIPDGLPVSRAFALSIARRESEFDPAARSGAGARGLMQVMPATGEMMARKLGMEHDVSRLSSDPAYNAKMGAAYLAQLVEEFGPSVALVASGYNAGPGRPRRWIDEYGDPRRPEVDVIDWVEAIPFTETRTYVMRVVESLVIYRARLRGTTGPVRVTAELKG
ncbi:lytic transglycosylase domain-containing protein [Aliigemmobacter aestuarii]|uniref:Lytic transglycosylase domain-containing protein n=1 Tax=Aliigemmobacter aestuarii TaxID=1445661 RepID=A0A4S3MRY5_9RHOB|nr:lytic transglycosylase domain-containing protein [Gemmobacter aestuarii]THD85316.1 lytic transglycosylase domain-containing protein [Gemmobacter aestuarii]